METGGRPVAARSNFEIGFAAGIILDRTILVTDFAMLLNVGARKLGTALTGAGATSSAGVTGGGGMAVSLGVIGGGMVVCGCSGDACGRSVGSSGGEKSICLRGDCVMLCGESSSRLLSTVMSMLRDGDSWKIEDSSLSLPCGTKSARDDSLSTASGDFVIDSCVDARFAIGEACRPGNNKNVF